MFFCFLIVAMLALLFSCFFRFFLASPVLFHAVWDSDKAQTMYLEITCNIWGHG